MNRKKQNLSFFGLSPDATRQQVDEAYHQLIKAWHPDLYQHDPEKKLNAERYTREINVAYQSLVKDWSEPGILTQLMNSELVGRLKQAIRSRRFLRGSFYSLFFIVAALSVYGAIRLGYLFDPFELLRSQEEPSYHRYSADEFVPLKQEVQRSLRRQKASSANSNDPNTLPPVTLAPLDSGEPRLGSRKSTPQIVRAAMNCDLDNVKALIDGDSNAIEETDKLGETALSWSVRQGCEEVVRELIRKGADVNHTAENGFTPLTWATLHRRKKIAGILQDSGAEPIPGYWKGGTYHRGFIDKK